MSNHIELDRIVEQLLFPGQGVDHEIDDHLAVCKACGEEVSRVNAFVTSLEDTDTWDLLGLIDEDMTEDSLEFKDRLEALARDQEETKQFGDEIVGRSQPDRLLSLHRHG